MAQQDSIQEIRKLRGFAAGLRGAVARWREKYSDRAHYDKQAFRFAVPDGRTTAAFTSNVMFEAYVGTFGSSSVSRGWSVDQDLAQRYFHRALNQHQQAIFDSMAAMAEADAAKLVGEAEQQLRAIQDMLTEARTAPAEVVAA